MEVYIFNFSTCQDLSLLEIGEQECTPLYSFGPYIRNEYIFHYVISGKGTVLFDPSGQSDGNTLSERVELNAGEGFLFEPHAKHMYAADEADPWHYIWIVFTGLSVPSYLHACGLTRRDPIFRPKDYLKETAEQIKKPLLKILQRPKASKAYIIGQLHLFFNALIENTAVSIAIASPDISIANMYIAEATRYIESRYSHIRSLDEIAEYCNITRSHLTRLFKNALHMSLQEYLIEYRLSKARELLVNTNLPIYQIAEQVGYDSPLNLNKAFKNRMHMPPKVWRMQNKSRSSMDSESMS